MLCHKRLDEMFKRDSVEKKHHDAWSGHKLR